MGHLVMPVVAIILINSIPELETFKKHPKAVRILPIDEYMISKRLKNGNLITTITTPSANFCALTCSTIPKCRSFNFCSAQISELNEDNVYSMGSSILQDDAFCDYRGMLQDDQPECEELGSEKDINDDENPGTCAINLKRADSLWGPWETRLSESATEWKKYEWRKRGVNVIQEEERVLYWYKFSGGGKSWTDAKIYCGNIDGQLFWNVNGTKAQIDFFPLPSCRSETLHLRR